MDVVNNKREVNVFIYIYVSGKEKAKTISNIYDGEYLPKAPLPPRARLPYRRYCYSTLYYAACAYEA